MTFPSRLSITLELWPHYEIIVIRIEKSIFTTENEPTITNIAPLSNHCLNLLKSITIFTDECFLLTVARGVGVCVCVCVWWAGDDHGAKAISKILLPNLEEKRFLENSALKLPIGILSHVCGKKQ